MPPTHSNFCNVEWPGRLACALPLAALLLALTACGRGPQTGADDESGVQVVAAQPARIEARPAPASSATAVAISPVSPPPTPDPGPPGLVGYRWQILLATAADGRPVPALQPSKLSQIYLQFDDDQRMTIAGLCGEISGDYRLRDDRVIESSGLAQLALGCDSRLDQAASIAANQHLLPPYRYLLDGQGVLQRLRLLTRDGTQLILQTTDAAWGSKPVEMLLEVAAEEVGCFGLPGGGSHCMLVRELRSVLGLRVPVSAWYRFYGPIEGYRHQPGAHELVRIRHYPLMLRGRLVSSYALNSATPLTAEPTRVKGSVGGAVGQ